MSKIELYGDQGFVELVDHMGVTLDIVNAARVSLDRISYEYKAKDEKLLKFLLLHTHTSPLEMCEFKFRIKMPLPYRNQFFRHRTACYHDQEAGAVSFVSSQDYKYWSLNELSRRYTSSNVDVYFHSEWRLEGGAGDYICSEEISTEVMEHYKRSICLYKRLLDLGVEKGQAREVLPQACMTQFMCKIDGNNLLKFLILRLAKDAQEEIRDTAIAIRDLTYPYIGEVFDFVFGEDMLGYYKNEEEN